MAGKLEKLAICQGLTTVELSTLEAIAVESSLKKGSRLFTEGEPGDALYVVVSGAVEITKKDQLLATLEAGAAVGEMSLIVEGETRSANAYAQSDVTLIKLPAAGFQKLLGQNDTGALKVVHNLAKVMSKRLSLINDKLVDSLGKKKKEELADFGKILNKWSF
jgi:CRP-like cAMP-binding protein